MRVLIAAGGTAGHINPALAIAGALKKADPTAEIHFAGRKEGMEYRLVTQAGYPFHHIEITGFQRKLSLHNNQKNQLSCHQILEFHPFRCRVYRPIPKISIKQALIFGKSAVKFIVQTDYSKERCPLDCNLWNRQSQTSP